MFLDDIFSFVPEKIACCSDPRFPRTICNAITIANKEFCEEWIDDRNELIDDCIDSDEINELSEHIMFDIYESIEDI